MAGRKPSIDSELIDEEILKHKNDIVGLNPNLNKQSKFSKIYSICNYY